MCNYDTQDTQTSLDVTSSTNSLDDTIETDNTEADNAEMSVSGNAAPDIEKLEDIYKKFSAVTFQLSDSLSDLQTAVEKIEQINQQIEEINTTISSFQAALDQLDSLPKQLSDNIYYVCTDANKRSLNTAVANYNVFVQALKKHQQSITDSFKKKENFMTDRFIPAMCVLIFLYMIIKL